MSSYTVNNDHFFPAAGQTLTYIVSRLCPWKTIENPMLWSSKGLNFISLCWIGVWIPYSDGLQNNIRFPLVIEQLMVMMFMILHNELQGIP